MKKEDLIEAILKQIDFEENWLRDVFAEYGHIAPMDVHIAMDGIRHVFKDSEM